MREGRKKYILSKATFPNNFNSRFRKISLKTKLPKRVSVNYPNRKLNLKSTII